jgi:23S rRNA (adenine2503-C2)-methyltransferase
MPVRLDLAGFERPELQRLMSGFGEKPFRGDQVFSWVHAKRALSFDEMTDLPLDLRKKMAEVAGISSLRVITAGSSEDGTRKYLFGCEDGQAIESVLIPHRYGTSVCVSSQAGCRMACAFCASAQGGLSRDLTSGEIVGQVLFLQRELDSRGTRVSRLDFMGTGEPLDNYDNVMKAIRIASDERGLGIGSRRITISTCGLVPGIRRLAREGMQVTLSVSLHAPDNALRSSLMPVNRRYPLEELMAAADEFSRITKRRVTFEYALIQGTNDSPELARRLAGLLRGRLAHVNVIPLNYVPGRRFARSDRDRVRAFAGELEKAGITTTLRREMGFLVDAACGQLRRREIDAAGRPIGTRPGKSH